MGDCNPDDGGCKAVTNLADEVHNLVVEVRTWTESHVLASARFVSEQDKKVDIIFDKLEKCLDTMTTTAIQQAAQAPAVEAVKKNIDDVAGAGRKLEDDLEDHTDKDRNHFAGEEKTALLASLKWIVRSITAQWVCMGLIALFLVLGDHGQQFMEWFSFWK